MPKFGITNIHKFLLTNFNIYFFVAILSAIVFCLIYGIKVLDPTYTDWLLTPGQDRMQHYVGWEAFRRSDWMFPIGLFNNLNYPDRTSIIFTDSIPLFAILFKILSPILPVKFQYFGIWGLLCFILQGIIVTKIIKIYTNNIALIITSSLLTLLAPVMITRMFGHTALAGQWTILFGLMILYCYQQFTFRQVFILVTLLGIISPAVHMYFVLMNGIIIVGIIIYTYLQYSNFKSSLMLICAYLISCTITVYLLGGFSSSGVNYTEGGLGFYSFNLNAFINPLDWSCILKNQPVYTHGQREGFAYLGVGGILLCLSACLLVYINTSKNIFKLLKYKNLIYSLSIVFMIILFVALTHKASVGNMPLYTIDLPALIEKIWGIFRACGRIIMVNWYILILSSLIILICKLKKKAIPVLIVITLLQFYDIHHILKNTRASFSKQIVYESILKENLWTQIGQNSTIKHVIITYWMGTETYDFAEWAINNNKTLNMYAFAHPNIDQLLKKVNQELLNVTEEKIYIFKRDEDLSKLEQYNLYYYVADNYIIGYSKKIQNYQELKI